MAARSVVGDSRFRKSLVGKIPFASCELASDIFAMAKPQRIEPDLRARIRHRLEQLGRSPIEAAVNVGLERNYIRDFIDDRKRSISHSKAPLVAQALDWSLAQLSGEELFKGHRREISALTIVPEIEVRVTSHDEAEEARNFGLDEAVGAAAIRGKWSIPSPFLSEELHMRAGRAVILPIRGDSMAEALFDGDRAIVDLDDVDVSQGGIFALFDANGHLVVRQVEPVRGSKPQRILCTPRNPHYRAFELVLEDPARIIGRVASKITRL